IKVGKKADLIIIDMEKPQFYPKLDIVSSLIYSAQASDVCSVICDGRLLMRGRELITIDEMKVCSDADDAAKRLIGKPL
ncbi:MAG: N-ethylammeline chlorohydrolase, partial [Spirochaetota bacterium]|nr:N-ethylammeline chlorohydrolase [Spirochaetota bacterium]